MIIVNDLMRPEVLAGIRGFIFDCDGVLIDSFAANVWYYNHFRAHFGLPPMSPEEERYTHTRNTFDSFRHILPPERYEEAMRMRETFDYRLVLPHVRREPGVRGLLLWLRSRGFRLAVNTSRAGPSPRLTGCCASSRTGAVRARRSCSSAIPWWTSARPGPLAFVSGLTATSGWTPRS